MDDGRVVRDFKNSEWDDWLKLEMFLYNTSVHKGTKCTPYKLDSEQVNLYHNKKNCERIMII